MHIEDDTVAPLDSDREFAAVISGHDDLFAQESLEFFSATRQIVNSHN
jgi:hypothetical protein